MKQRIEFIDALRGFTMILVVFAHVETFMLSIDPGTTFISRLFLSFRMPLFFFISGYLSYKEGKIWTVNVWKTSVWNKFRVQLIPTAFFGLLYTYLFRLGGFLDFFRNYHKFGYWFTICLLGMLVIMYTINCVVNLLNKNNPPSRKLTSLLLIVVSMILWGFKFIYDKYSGIATISNYFCFHQVCVYFPFFAFGVIASEYKIKFANFLDNEVIQACVYVAFGVVFYLKNMLNETTTDTTLIFLVYRSIQDIILGVLGICIVYNFFRKNSSMFSSATLFGRQLQRVGSRTLDIYMLHYFFLTKISFGNAFVRDSNIVCELLFVGALAVVITYCCLFVSDMLRTSKFFSVFLFGMHK